MGILNNLFGGNKSLEDKILALIDKHYSSFTRINQKNSNSDLEGRILLLSVVFEYLQKRTTDETPIVFNLMSEFSNKLSPNAVQTINKNGLGPANKFILERISFYNSNFQYFTSSMGKTIPMGICFCLYANPLGKVEYITYDGDKIGFTDEYSYTNLPVIMKFIQTYLPVRTKFINELQKIL